MKARVGHSYPDEDRAQSLFIPCRASADAGSLDCVRSSAGGRFFFARDDRVLVRSTMECVSRGVRRSHLSQRARKMGHPSFVVVLAECRDPSLGALGFAKDSAASG
jgi:hypothetical protein